MKYCIWTYKYGQMDTSEDWGKLFDLIERSRNNYPFTKFWIIPLKDVGKGQFKDYKQIQQEMKETLRKANESIKRSQEAMMRADLILAQRK